MKNLTKNQKNALKPITGQFADFDEEVKVISQYTIAFYEEIGYTEKARLFKEFIYYRWLQYKMSEIKIENPTMYKVFMAVTDTEQTTSELKTTTKLCQKSTENYLKLLAAAKLIKCNKIEWRGRHKYMFMWSLP